MSLAMSFCSSQAFMCQTNCMQWPEIMNGCQYSIHRSGHQDACLITKVCSVNIGWISVRHRAYIAPLKLVLYVITTPYHFNYVIWGLWYIHWRAGRLFVQWLVQTYKQTHHSSTLSAPSEGIRRSSVDSLHKGLMMRKVFLCPDVIEDVVFGAMMTSLLYVFAVLLTSESSVKWRL